MLNKIIAVFIALLCAATGLSYDEITSDDIKNIVPGDCISVSNYICDNLELFTEAFNQGEDDENLRFEATYCEERIPVYVISLDVDGIYLDFNDSNGYMIVIDDYGVVAFENKGDLEYLKGADKCYYSITDKFVYFNDDGSIVPYEPQPVLTEEEWNEMLLEKKYAGQELAGDGAITDTNQYVKDKYGSNYKVYQSKSLYGFRYMRQYRLSMYYEWKNGSKYSEGNCTLSSIYALMNYLQSSGKYPKLPAYNQETSYNAKNDAFYKTYANKSNFDIETPKSLPNLYLSIRNYAVKNHGYKVSGTNPFNIGSIIKGVAKEYGYNSIKTSHILIWSFDGQVVSEIDAGYPTIWNCANSSTYGSHSLVVTGYKQYRKTTTILGINFYSYVSLMQVNDNWTTYARYFDFTNYGAFGSFVKVR